MNKRRRGLVLIFNQVHFSCPLRLKPRFGSDVNCSNLKKRLTGLGFELKPFTDLMKDEVNDKIDEVKCSTSTISSAKTEHSDADCFSFVFLSHGEKDYVYARDDILAIKDITDKFKGTNCSSLVGNPKLFIWQACRGDEPDDSVTSCDATNTEANHVMETGAVYTLPAAADFLMCYSVAEGFYAFRDHVKGSCYIQDLCELLKKYGDSLEFTDLLTLVNRKVSLRSVEMCKDPKAIGKKQVPCFSSMLTKKLYFR